MAFAELRRWLLGTPATNRDDFYAHPQREVFLLLRAQQSTLTCSFSKWLQDSQLSECPSLLMDVNVILLAEHRAPQSVGNPGGCSS